MSKRKIVKLGEINQFKHKLTNPCNTPDQLFELYSVPSFDENNPEIIKGSLIGSVKQVVQDGDVLLCKINPRINRVWIVKKRTNYPLVASSEWVVFRTSDMIPNYLLWQFRSRKFRNLLCNNTTGIGGSLTRTQPKQIAQYCILKPSFEEQCKMASILDAVSDLLKLRKQRLADLDKLIQEVFYEMFGDPIANEKHWKVGTLSLCCQINPKKSEITYFTDGFKVSFVAMADVSEDGKINTSKIKTFDQVKTGFTYFYENDILFAKITPCMENGKGAVAKSLTNNIGFGSTEFHVFRPIQGVSNSEWIFRLTQLPVFRQTAEKNMTGSAGQKRVPTAFLNDLIIGIPPLSLQTRFASIVQKIEEQKTIVQRSIDETQALFDSLMSQYFDD